MGLADHLRNQLGKSKLQKLRRWKPKPELLLQPNVPKPLHGVAPRVILGPQWWNRTRQAAYRSTDYHCLACGVSKYEAAYHHWLEGHEIYRINYARGRAYYRGTVPLCHFCHNYIHDGRLRAMVESGEIHHAKYVAIIRHGDSVLKRAGLSRPTLAEREELIHNQIVAPWGKWRLVLNRKLYPPKFETPAQWHAAFDP